MLRVYCENGGRVKDRQLLGTWQSRRGRPGLLGCCPAMPPSRPPQEAAGRRGPLRAGGSRGSRVRGKPRRGRAGRRAGGQPGPGLEAPELRRRRRRRPGHGDALRPVYPATHPLPPPAPPPPSPPAPLSLSRLEPRQKQREAAGRDATGGPRARPD